MALTATDLPVFPPPCEDCWYMGRALGTNLAHCRHPKSLTFTHFTLAELYGRCPCKGEEPTWR